MSLVDYASSSDDDEQVSEEEEEKEKEDKGKEQDENPSLQEDPVLHNQQSLTTSPPRQSDEHSQSSISSILKLPDASELLNSPIGSSHQMIGADHSSRVAAAMAESASRKRESNGSCSSMQRGKHPRGNLPPSRISPDTVGGLLPPQLRGRSNVVTEDIGKLFVNRRDT